jgi:prepilin-type N-terminal cleavage/methylation domain-containing protein
MREPRKTPDSGFSLVEIVAVLLLVAILAAMAVMGVVSMSGGFLQSREITTAAEKAQCALTRIAADLVVIQSVTSGSGKSLVYQALDSAGNVRTHTLSVADAPGSPLTLDGAPLLDALSSFAFSYVSYNGGVEATGSAWTPAARAIVVDLTMRAAPGIPFTLRVFPRNR